MMRVYVINISAVVLCLVYCLLNPNDWTD